LEKNRREGKELVRMEKWRAAGKAVMKRPK
jgi:hypothetical protein